MSYAAQHASAHALVARKGAAVTFTYTTSGTYTEATDVTTGSASASVAGVAVAVRGDPERYRALGLVQSEAPTLLFVPDTYGDVPPLDASVVFGGTAFTVRSVDHVNPDGTPIIAKVVVAR